MNNQNNDVCYHTKAPRMNLKSDWQIKLDIIANTNRENFASDKEYKDYIEKHTQYSIDEQNSKYKKACIDLEKYTKSKKEQEQTN